MARTLHARALEIAREGADSTMARQYGVALYRDGKYEGTVAHPRAKITTWQDACILAERWRKAYAHKYQYRAVEFDAQGYLVRTEATNA